MNNNKSFTSGGVLSSLIKYAIPVLVAMFLQSLYGAVDLLVVGQFAETIDVSGVATGSLLMQTVTMIITGLSMGVTIYVGQKIGEKKEEEAGKAIRVCSSFFLSAPAIYEEEANLAKPGERIPNREWLKVLGTIFNLRRNIFGEFYAN